MCSDDEGKFDVGCLAGASEEGPARREGAHVALVIGEIKEEPVFGNEDNDFFGEGQGEPFSVILQGNPKAPRPRDPVLRTQDHEGTPIHRLGFAGGGSPVVA